MKLSFNDLKEIEVIISKFTEEDNERIYAAVDWQMNQLKSNPLTPVIQSFCSDSSAFSLAADTSEWQERVHHAMWDSLTEYHKYDYALAIFIKRHGTQEAA